MSSNDLSAYGPVQRAKDIAAVGVFLWLCGLTARRIVLEGDEPAWPAITLAVVLGLFAADFVSGFVHWLGDTWGSIDMPVLGPAFIRSFREHHVDPKAITRHDFFETNGNNCFVSIPVVAYTSFGPWLAGLPGVFVATLLLAMVFWVFLTNQIHKWSHMDSPPAFIAALQRMHLILNPAHHEIHHTKPYDQYYCITNGWMNPILAKLDFFRRAERLVTALTGLQPRAEDKVTAKLV